MKNILFLRGMHEGFSAEFCLKFIRKNKEEKDKCDIKIENKECGTFITEKML